jgi:peroxiredoxin Q/BCP
MRGLKVGEAAPDFTLPADNGSTVSLKDLIGRRVVLYFYPKNDTPGCTRQSCEFRDLAGQFDKRNTVVLGVSRDDLASHGEFKKKFKLNFPLLSDIDHKVHALYGAWGDKNLPNGKTTVSALRTTVVIDEQGKILSWEKGVNPDGNARKVLEALR